MVRSEEGGGGTEGTLSCPGNVTAGHENMDGVFLKAFSPKEKTEDCADEWDVRRLTLNSETMAQPAGPLSSPCVGPHQDCVCTAFKTTRASVCNGDMDCVLQTVGSGADISLRNNEEMGSDANEAKLANGGLFLMTQNTALSTDTVIHTHTADVDIPPLEKHLATSCESGTRESGHVCKEPNHVLPVAPSTQASLPDCTRSDPSHSTSLASPAQTEDCSAASGLQDRLRGEPSDRGLPPRTLSLETVPSGALCLSCDSTPLSPQDQGLLRVDGQEELRFMNVSLSSRNTFESSRRQSAPDNLPEGLTVASVPSPELALQSKKPGISEYFGRGLFSRKQKETKPLSPSAPGWKLFGKLPLRENPPKDSRTIQQDSNPGNLTSVSTPNLLNTGEYEAKMGKSGHSPPPHPPGRRKNLEFEPLSTTALILEDRPANLPAKSVEEAQRHRQEYDEMVAEAKKRELKEAQRKKRQMKERLKQEEVIANAMVIWNTDILPNWESMRNTRRVRELWWQGLPPNVRGRVWSLGIGNELNITPELYEIFLSRAKERWKSFSEAGSKKEVDDLGTSLADRESSLDLIKLDISRTFPPLFIFQKGGPYHDLLPSVLGAYTCYRPDVGYVQGMSFIAAVLILNLEEADAFIAFANLLNKPCQMAFFRVDHDLMLKYFAAFEVFFEENLPRLFQHFRTSSLTPDFYLIDWIFTLYSKSLPLDVACRVWDVFCRDGEEFLFRTALGILRLYEDVLLQMDFIHVAQFLARLPDDMAADPLFSCIAATQMVSSSGRWTQVFNALMKDNRDVDKSSSPALKASGFNRVEP